MNFSKYIKKLDREKRIVEIETKYIPINTIKCQYNFDRYRHWKAACGESLDITNGPFWEYLHYKKTDKYVKLFQLYGRSEGWITNNILKFNQLLEDIRNNGYDKSKGLPIVMNKPIVNNPYNSGYCIFEGTRRLSICLYLNIKQKVKLCKVI